MGMLRYDEFETPDYGAMSEAGRIAALAHDVLEAKLQPGVTAVELDEIAEAVIRDEGAKPAFDEVGDPERTITVSINDELIHAPPSPGTVIDEGDVVSVDLGANYEGHYSDTAVTHIVGTPAEAVHENLLERTKSALYAGLLRATAGNTLVDVGRAIEQKAGDFGTVTGWAGHFIGRRLHLAPQVYNTADQNEPFNLQSGMYLAVEPVLTLSENARTLERAGGAVRTASGAIGAHFEHTVRVGENRAEILTARSSEPETL